MEKTTNFQLIFLTFIIIVLYSGSLGWHNRFNIRVNKRHPNIWHYKLFGTRESMLSSSDDANSSWCNWQTKNKKDELRTTPS